TLLRIDPGLRITVVCGENQPAYETTQKAFRSHPNVKVLGAVGSLLPAMAESVGVITKPGISTLLEAHAARRKIFLLKGMPVAEDNNARYAVRHWGAEWFGEDNFRKWRRSLSR